MSFIAALQLNSVLKVVAFLLRQNDCWQNYFESADRKMKLDWGKIFFCPTFFCLRCAFA
jgi:hypothetical protein